MKFPNPGTYLCYRKVGSDKWKIEREFTGDRFLSDLIASKHPDRQWALFEVSQVLIIDVEKTDL